MRPTIKLAFTLLAISVFLLTVLSPPANAYSYETVSATTDWINIGGGVTAKITLDYRFSNTLSVGTKIDESPRVDRGNIYTDSLTLEDGKITVAISLPEPINQVFEEEFMIYNGFTNNLNSINFLISNIITAKLEAVPTAKLSISGPAHLNDNTLTISELGASGAQTYSFTVDSSATGEQSITVKHDFDIDLRLGLSINVLGFERTIASTSIGKFSLTPTLSQTVTINNNLIETLLQPFSLVFGTVLLVCIFTFAFAFSIRKKKHEFDAKQRQIPERLIKNDDTSL